MNSYFCRSSFFLACFVIFSFCAVAQNEPYRVRNNVAPCLNVRANPQANAASIDCLTPGTTITVVNSVLFWREIIYGNNQRGWVAKKYIEPVETDSLTITGSTAIPANAFLTVHFVDVGQGDAIWIQTFDDGIDGNGKFEGYSIVIDGGPYSADNSNPLLPYMESQGHHGADIEALFITHPHDDHFSGAETISRHFTVNHYYDPGYPSQLSSYAAFKNAMKGTSGHPGKAKMVHIGQANFGTINWGSELKVEVLYSWKGDPNNELGSGNTEVNNSSIVLRVQYGDHVFLFMGDAEGKKREDDAMTPKYVEKILLQTVPDRLKATVLKIAHHGSETSSTLPFISAVNPDIVLVQSGRKSFGGTFLPDISTLQRYCDNNPDVKIYRTDQRDQQAGHTGRAAADGDHIIIKSNGSGQPQVKALQGGQVFTGNFCSN
jgi:beta-lactamase superfamily II metal-dependent hydrolase